MNQYYLNYCYPMPTLSYGVNIVPSSYFPTIEKNYHYCYEWRRIVMKNKLWAQLPQELIENIANYCITYTNQPSGTANFSNIRIF